MLNHKQIDAKPVMVACDACEMVCCLRSLLSSFCLAASQTTCQSRSEKCAP